MRQRLAQMTKSPKHLILTSDLNTWKYDRELLFLGKWCLKESDKSVWKSMVCEIAPPIGATPRDRDFLLSEARRIESNLFPKFADILNDFHNVEYDLRYWKILTGHWFRNTTEMLVNRIYTIKRCFDEYNIEAVSTYGCNIEILPQSNYTDSIMKANNEIWNATLYEKIIDLLIQMPPKLEKNIINPMEELDRKEQIQKNHKFSKENVYTNSRKIARKFLHDTDAFIVNSYLPLSKEFLLDAILGQFPQWFISPEFKSQNKPDALARANAGSKLELNSNGYIESAVGILLFCLIPLDYFEDYVQLNDLANAQDWPKKPKFIFTSNNFASDDVFKAWTAKMVVDGTKYIVGQHGAGYGTYKYEFPTIEEASSDAFITWGWARPINNYRPGFVFKNAARRKRKLPGGKLLIIEEPQIPRILLWEQADKFLKYVNEQFTFLRALETEVYDNVLVRLSVHNNDMWSEERLHFRNFDQNLEIDNGSQPIRELWLESRVVVHSYDSTGLLETLEANIPTLAFWQNGLTHLVAEAIPAYLLLVQVGIVHLTPESAAQKINEIWDNVDSWWRSGEIQNARREFCSQYARTSNKPVRELRKILLENI